jgi:structural maintenance of chromosome 3 (chondroitin sulfate proteoglycan 6)
LFDVDDRYNAAVEVIGGMSLFHVVVDSDQTATKILDVLNKEKSGRVTFMPLNRLQPKEFDFRVLSPGNSVPLIQKLRYDRVLHKAFSQVFGKSVVCPDLDEADRCARQHGLNAVTMTGDRVGRRGEITGGYRDKKKSRMGCIKSVKGIKNSLATETNKSSEAQRAIQQVEQAILQIRDDQAKADRLKRELMDPRDPLSSQLSTLEHQHIQCTELVLAKEKSWSVLDKSIQNLKLQLGSYQAELVQPFKKALTDQEVERLDSLAQELKELEEQVSQVSRERLQVRKMTRLIR